MWIFTIFLSLAGLAAKCCVALAVHEGGTVVTECNVPTSTRKLSPVYWYTFKFSEYLSEDYRITVKTNLTDNLLNRLSVIGTNGNYNLKIINVTYEDAGEYSCGYYSSGNRWVTVSTEIIRIHAPIPPHSGYPLCATEPSDQLYPGTEVRLVCISRGGTPPATLTWYREGAPLRTSLSSTEFEGYHERTLLEEDNGVKFVCKASSPGFDTPKECSVTPLRIIPRVQIYASHDPVTVGQDVEYKCVGEGVPAISSYFWYWNGELITDNYSDRLIIGGDNGQILTLKSTQQSENNALILCVVETITELRNTDHIRLTLQSAGPSVGEPNLTSLPDTGRDTGPATGSATGLKDGTDSSLSVGAVFGCIMAGIAITLIAFGLVKAASRFKNRQHGNMDFNRISLSNLNNYRQTNLNEDETIRLNQTTNKTCNLGVIDLVGANDDTDYDHIQDNDNHRKQSTPNDHKQMEQPYASPDFKNKSPQIGCEGCHAMDAVPTKVRSPSNLDAVHYHAVDENFSEYVLPKGATPTPRTRSQTVVTQTNSAHYQRPTRRMMPKIQENSINQPLIKMKSLAISLPDLTPAYTRSVSVPIDIEMNHDYVNMGVAATSSTNSSFETSEIPDYHDYVNYKGRRRNPIDRSDSSSSGYCEEPESPRLISASPTKKIRYAELDFPESTDQDLSVLSSSTDNILKKSSSLELEQTYEVPETGTPPLTSYAEIAYVFKDRRQQSEPSVKRTSVTR